MNPSKTIIPITLLLLAAVAIAGCGDESSGANDATGASDESMLVPQPTEAQLKAAGLAELPLAPESKRLDLVAPTFSNPTEVTNPLFPVSDLHSTVFSGRVDGKPFHTETTLLPETRVIEWAPGHQVEALVSQYFAYIDGRIEEVALDYYAQADDGSVWYLGEDVYDYNEDGLVDSFEGSWLAGRQGPPEMIMPGDPQVGDVHRAENIPAIAFEEVEVTSITKTVDGPTGPVHNALVARELHDDGTFSDKIFAPGYGEFYTAHGSEVEAMALAVPTDALEESPPPELDELAAEAGNALEAVSAQDWSGAGAATTAAQSAWDDYRSGSQVPPRLATEMNRGLKELTAAVAAREAAQSGTAAIDVAQSALDFELRHLPPPEIDLARFELWTRQVGVDDAAGDTGGVNGDVFTLKWIRDRFAETLDPADLTRIDAHLALMAEGVIDADTEAVAAESERLLDTLAGVEPVTSTLAP